MGNLSGVTSADLFRPLGICDQLAAHADQLNSFLTEGLGRFRGLDLSYTADRFAGVLFDQPGKEGKAGFALEIRVGCRRNGILGNCVVGKGYMEAVNGRLLQTCLLYTSPSPRD